MDVDLTSLSPEDLLQEATALRRIVTELRQEVKTLKSEASAEDKVDRPLFQIDTEPLVDEDAGAQILYDAHAKVALDDATSGKKEDDRPLKMAPRSTCFNCKGDHMIADCPVPRDGRAIARNRREFQKSAGATSARYHVDEEQRFGHLRPGGEPSAKLREALSLRDGELPSFVYRMRQLGYPPGWLLEAEIHRSGVGLFLSDGSEGLADMSDEEGQVVDAADKVTYDTDKIVAWPGFNVDAPAGTHDQTEYFRCPPMREEQRREHMLQAFSKKKQTGYVRGDMQDTATTEVAGEKAKVATAASIEAESPLLSDAVREKLDCTPIPSVFSPFASLPGQQSWAKDVTDHILFENLPNTTGKWDKMREVIKKSRQLRKGDAMLADSMKMESQKNSLESAVEDKVEAT